MSSQATEVASCSYNPLVGVASLRRALQPQTRTRSLHMPKRAVESVGFKLSRMGHRLEVCDSSARVVDIKDETYTKRIEGALSNVCLTLSGVKNPPSGFAKPMEDSAYE